ncbi:G-protein subunit alpha 8 [Heterostelium album PN500]|uniref:G-protein subunit alpha 8 n=1 Tax=Heterostelium pallidum (strain ATCC 26659 / Pp 5 / PN500) TaxID=670386 RepID=D3AYH4_HETP5|nr:G-protein subunit alpha 8 [Heterostelium album PN500]EFA86001.1 G-protein subunit alpha 8 [Heterostelium album PN500]|eukprot:XP_020438107.1 G-protein subunit alpha 8 [Heterostelium album PN500]
MGCNTSTIAGPETKQNEEVESYLRQANKEAMLDFRILLLGAGESGKSTVVKQLKSIYKLPVDDAELQSYAANIHKNTVLCMQVLLEAGETLNIELSNPETKRRANNIRSFQFEQDVKQMPANIGLDIEELWKDPDIQTIWDRRSEYWFLDATPYYFENIERFLDEDFRPTEEDCIMTRVRTTGISVTEFDDGPVHFRVVDVGGQRNERKKWIHCFDDVKALLFVVNLAGYDQVMFEDPSQNRMQESLTLFGQICNNPIFADTPTFLMLNKKDLFEQMIQKTDLSKCFPEYRGGPDTKVALEFIKSQFQAKLQPSNKTLNTHYIAARYKKDIKFTWDEVKSVLLEENKKILLKATREIKRKNTQKILNTSVESESANGWKSTITILPVTGFNSDEIPDAQRSRSAIHVIVPYDVKIRSYFLVELDFADSDIHSRISDSSKLASIPLSLESCFANLTASSEISTPVTFAPSLAKHNESCPELHCRCSKSNPLMSPSRFFSSSNNVSQPSLRSFA